MEATTEKPHLSATQLTTYGRCPEQYRRRYVEGQKLPPGIAQLRGRSVHAGAELNFRQKIASHQDLPVTQVVDRAVAEYDGQLALEDVLLTAEEAARGKPVVVGAERDRTARLAGLWAAEVGPLYQPEAVEERQRIVLPAAPRDLLGVLDFVGHLVAAPTARGIVDYKTTARKSPAGRWDADVALSVYALTYRARYGEAPRFLHVEELVDGTTPRVERTVTTRARADFEALVARLNAVLAALQAGLFPPAPVGAWWCAPRFCGYFNAGCPYVNAERKSAGENVNKR